MVPKIVDISSPENLRCSGGGDQRTDDFTPTSPGVCSESFDLTPTRAAPTAVRVGHSRNMRPHHSDRCSVRTFRAAYDNSHWYLLDKSSVSCAVLSRKCSWKSSHTAKLYEIILTQFNAKVCDLGMILIFQVTVMPLQRMNPLGGRRF